MKYRSMPRPNSF